MKKDSQLISEQTHIRNRSRNIEYFRNIMDYSRGYMTSYGDHDFNSKTHRKIQSIISSIKVYDENIDSLTGYNQSSTKAGNTSPKKIPNIKKIDYKTPLALLDEYYNKQYSERVPSTKPRLTRQVQIDAMSLSTQMFKSPVQQPKKAKIIGSNFSSLCEKDTKDTKVSYVPPLIQKNEYLTLSPNANIYKLPENLHSIRKTLGDHIKVLADKSRLGTDNITNDQILTSLEKTKNSEYSKDIIDKIKIINFFINNVPPEKFRANKSRHRKVFVIIDGTVVFQSERIVGEFVEIPTRRFLRFLPSKRERLMEFYNFLNRCQKIFRATIPFKNVFLLNGISISDLIEIPETDNVLYISSSNIFRGICFMERGLKHHKKDYLLLKIDETRRARNFSFHKKPKNFFKRLKQKKVARLLKPNKKQFPTKKVEINYLNDQSFTFGISYTSKEKYVYYSDDEPIKKAKKKKATRNAPSLVEDLIKFNEDDKIKRINEAIEKGKKMKEKLLKKRVDENTYEGLDFLITKYNETRGKKNKINTNHNLRCTIKEQEKEVKENTLAVGNQLLRKLKIFNTSNEANDIMFDYDRFNDTNKKEVLLKNQSIIRRNKLIVSSYTHPTEKRVGQYYPDLISLNIPRVLKTFPKLKRTVFYEIFVQFKLLLIICICINKNLKLLKKGIDFDTFFNCMPQIRSQGRELAKKIYDTINKLNSDFLNWEEYLIGMLTMKSKNISDKIDVFFKVIDTDGNGLLSFDEVYELSLASLKRTIGESNEDDEVINILAEYFANLIFSLVDKPIDEEIPLDLIKEKIIEGKSAAGYLEMFICADSFT